MEVGRLVQRGQFGFNFVVDILDVPQIDVGNIRATLCFEDVRNDKMVFLKCYVLT